MFGKDKNPISYSLFKGDSSDSENMPMKLVGICVLLVGIILTISAVGTAMSNVGKW